MPNDILQLGYTIDPCSVPPDQFIYNVFLYFLPWVLLPINMYPGLNKRRIIVNFQFFVFDVGVCRRNQYDLEFAPMQVVPDDDLVSVALQSCPGFWNE